MVSWDLMVFNHLVMTKIAMENPPINGAFTRKIIDKWAMASMAMLNNQRV